MDDSAEVFTIGHSRLSYDDFVNILMTIGINMIVDVRSAPYSRHFPHFSRDNIKRELEIDGISYLFLGDDLGGRPRESKFFCEGVADYEKMADAPSFKNGIGRVLKGKEDYRLALMCSEHNPLDCHRCLLVGRALADKGVAVGHIYSDGSVRTQAEIEASLLNIAEKKNVDMFKSMHERLAAAYKHRSQRVAYSSSGRAASTSVEARRE